MVRIFKWMKSYFQIIETISNRNHHIDMIMINEEHQLILIVENMSADKEESMIQVHRYTSSCLDTSDTNEMELITERVQDIFIPFEISASNLFLYMDTDSSQLLLTACDGIVLKTVNKKKCHYYVWKSDGIDDKTLFKGTEKCQFEHAMSDMFNRTGNLSIHDRNEAGNVIVFETMIALDDVKVIESFFFYNYPEI